MDDLPYHSNPFTATPKSSYATAVGVLIILGLLALYNPSNALGISPILIAISVGMLVHGIKLKDGLDSLRRNVPEEYRKDSQGEELPKKAVDEVRAEAERTGTSYGFVALVVFFLGMLFASLVA